MLARLFIRALLVLMLVAVLESVFRNYWLPWCLMVIECFLRVACCDNVKMMHGPINVRLFMYVVKSTR